MNHRLTLEEVEILVAVLATAIAQHVPDPTIRHRIHDALNRELDQFNHARRLTLSADRCALSVLTEDEHEETR